MRRLHLKSQRELVSAEGGPRGALLPRAEAASREAPAEPWPVHPADLEPPDFAFGAK